jgi:hypothetical protein
MLCPVDVSNGSLRTLRRVRAKSALSPKADIATGRVLRSAHQLRDLPRLVARHELRRRAPAGLLLVIDTAYRLPVEVAGDETVGRVGPACCFISWNCS